MSRLDRRTQTSDIVEHIHNETSLNVICEQLKTKYDSYKSFCIRAPAKFHRCLMDPKIWPIGTLVKEYMQ